MRTYSLSRYDSHVLTSELGATEYFEQILHLGADKRFQRMEPKAVANWVMNEVFFLQAVVLFSS
jgi:Asp-tRNA(Asn)/Glu-tRNA(Gln) amidotransferase B subunit